MTLLLDQAKEAKLKNYVLPDILRNFDRIKSIYIKHLTGSENIEESRYIPYFETMKEMMDAALKKGSSTSTRRLDDVTVISIDFMEINTLFPSAGEFFGTVENFKENLGPDYDVTCLLVMNKDPNIKDFDGNLEDLLKYALASKEVVKRRISSTAIISLMVKKFTKD